jgi:hypothetical protein
VHLNPVSMETSGNVVNRKQYEVKFDINKLHKAIGYCGEVALQIKAKYKDQSFGGSTFWALMVDDYKFFVGATSSTKRYL